jgi:hypothetical protein
MLLRDLPLAHGRGAVGFVTGRPERHAAAATDEAARG